MAWRFDPGEHRGPDGKWLASGGPADRAGNFREVTEAMWRQPDILADAAQLMAENGFAAGAE